MKLEEKGIRRRCCSERDFGTYDERCRGDLKDAVPWNRRKLQILDLVLDLEVIEQTINSLLSPLVFEFTNNIREMKYKYICDSCKECFHRGEKLIINGVRAKQRNGEESSDATFLGGITKFVVHR